MKFHTILFLTLLVSGSANAEIRLLSTPCETALALSALPEPQRGDSTVYALTDGEYKKVIDGTGPFSCLVTRNHPESIVPLCFDKAGSEAILPSSMRRGEMILQGFTDEEFRADRNARFKRGEVKASKPGVSYMLSDYNYIYVGNKQRIGKVPPHMMYYAPHVQNADVAGSIISASNQPGLPFVNDPGVHGMLVSIVDTPSSSDEVIKQCEHELPAKPKGWLE